MLRLPQGILCASVAFAALAFSSVASADIAAPENDCFSAAAGSACSNAGPNDDEDGFCVADQQCTQVGDDGGVSTIPCTKCELPVDGGPAPQDAGPTPADSGPSPTDSGPGPADTGVTEKDSGPAADAGPGPATGDASTDTKLTGSSGCSTAPSAPLSDGWPFGVGVLGLALFASRKRRDA